MWRRYERTLLGGRVRRFTFARRSGRLTRTMKANARTPAEIFGNSVRYVVPLFQRPYVWTLEAQWEPLWEDVRMLAERVLAAPPVPFGTAPVSPHFLGAVVVDQQAVPAGFIDVRHVIDGQQRLTTLQLLLDAVQTVVAELGHAGDAAGLRSLVQNNPALAGRPEEVFKVWPTDRDQRAFTAAMDDDSIPSPADAATPIAQAHAYFADVARRWALADGDEEARPRLRALTQALAQHLKVVVIDLEPGDNAQVIFETLNHRGSPLLAADLIKNLVFQVAQQRGLDVERLYREFWREFDTDEWRAPQAQGRRFVPRIDRFFQYWLTMRLLREVPTDRVFTEFRDGVVRETADVVGLLAEIAHDAHVYASLERLPTTSVPGRFYYRVVRALDSAVVSPFLLWVLRQPSTELPADQRDRALAAVESWLVRRALTRATSKDLNNAVLGLLRALGDVPLAEVGDATVTFLESQRADSRIWPDDDAVTRALMTTPIYKSLTRPRMRMVLEALEDSMRGRYGEGQPCPRNLTIEHIMPQAWEEHWAGDLASDEETVETRPGRLHLLGNLTLVSGRLNPALSNRPWRDDQAEARGLGVKGKRSYLLEHAELKLSASVAGRYERAWTDADIEARTLELAQRVLKIWPGPVANHPVTATEPLVVEDAVEWDLPEDEVPEALDPEDRPPVLEPPTPQPVVPASGPAAGARNPAGTYRELGRWLADQAQDVVSLDFSQVEDVLGAPLPPSARAYEQHWRRYEGSALARAIVDAGWRTAVVDLEQERVVFRRDGDGAGQRRRRSGRQSGASGLSAVLAAGALQAGATLWATYHGVRHHVVVRADGRLEADGTVFESPTKAAMALTGQGAVNGWRFWRTDDGTPIAELRSPGTG
jgi:hypothetical protein